MADEQYRNLLAHPETMGNSNQDHVARCASIRHCAKSLTDSRTASSSLCWQLGGVLESRRLRSGSTTSGSSGRTRPSTEFSSALGMRYLYVYPTMDLDEPTDNQQAMISEVVPRGKEVSCQCPRYTHISSSSSPSSPSSVKRRLSSVHSSLRPSSTDRETQTCHSLSCSVSELSRW